MDKIGEGTYGVVFKAKDMKTLRFVAMKWIRFEVEQASSSGFPANALREVSVLTHLSHPNIVKLNDVLYFENRLVLIFEFMQYDLKHVMNLSSPYPLDSYTIKSYLYQIIQGIAYCHRHNIFHRDLKPQNILVDDDGIVKIADFGLSRPLSLFPHLSRYNPEMVTLWYRPPELLLGSDVYDTSADIWSIGCIFAEIVNHSPLFTGSTNYSQLCSIISLLGVPNNDDDMDALYTYIQQYESHELLYGENSILGCNTIHTSSDTTTTTANPSFHHGNTLTKTSGYTWDDICPRLSPLGIDLLSKMMKYNPKHRISAHEALCHEFFSDLYVVQVNK